MYWMRENFPSCVSGHNCTAAILFAYHAWAGRPAPEEAVCRSLSPEGHAPVHCHLPPKDSLGYPPEQLHLFSMNTELTLRSAKAFSAFRHDSQNAPSLWLSVSAPASNNPVLISNGHHKHHMSKSCMIKVWFKPSKRDMWKSQSGTVDRWADQT